MEYIDEVDINNQSTNKKFEKDEFHKKGMWYREVIGFVINDKKEVLIQKRSSNKRDKPNLWEICYGHVSSGEKPKEAIVRELKEEIGLEAKSDDLQHIGIEKTEEEQNGRYHNAFSYIYLIKTDKKIEDFKMQEEEVSDIKYIKLERLKEMLKNKDEVLAFSNMEFMPEILDKVISILNT